MGKVVPVAALLASGPILKTTKATSGCASNVEQSALVHSLTGIEVDVLPHASSSIASN